MQVVYRLASFDSIVDHQTKTVGELGGVAAYLRGNEHQMPEQRLVVFGRLRGLLRNAIVLRTLLS